MNLKPLLINFSKIQCDFLIEFFVIGEVETDDEEQMRNMLMNNSKFSTTLKKQGTLNNKLSNTEIQIASSMISKDKTEKQESVIANDYPIFFNHFKIEETELIVSYHHSENSYLVI